MSESDAIGEQVAEIFLRSTMDDELGDEVQVGSRIEVVRDTGSDDREDRGSALATRIEPGEEPVFSSEDQAPQLALTPIVREIDVAVFEEER